MTSSKWSHNTAVGARPLEVKKGADRGIDGRLYFHDSADASETKEALISVKGGGGAAAAHIRDLRGTVEREEAAIGVFLCIEPPTRRCSTRPRRPVSTPAPPAPSTRASRS